MSFFNKDEKKGGGPVVSGSPFKKSSAFGRTPMFSRAAGGLMDRLKNLSKRDMAFVGIGLSVLVMAPVAEYMMSQPTQDPMLTASGFGSREGGANGLYEPGINGLSTGSPDGAGEVITPLSSRDPASLILGAEPAQPPAPAAAPAAPPSSSWRDAMADSGRAAFSAAAKTAGAPTPIKQMQGMLRGISSFGSGGESSRTTGTLGGGNIIEKAKSASSKATARSMVGPVAMAGYKGVASNTPNSASKGEFEKLRSAADKSASNFSGGSAMGSLDKAAADAVEIGKGAGGIGALGDGEATKGSNAYDNKYTHQRSGETLAEMAAKQRLNKALEWEFFKKYEIPKTIINAVVGAIAKELGDAVGGAVHGILNPSGPSAPPNYCWIKGSGGTCYAAFPFSACGEKDKPHTNCDCVWVGPKDGTPPAGAGCPGTANPGPGPGPGPGQHPAGSPEHSYQSPTVTWPTNDVKEFDSVLTAFRKEIDKVEDTHRHPGEFTTSAGKLTKMFSDMTGISNQTYSFPFVVANIEAKAKMFSQAQGEYAGGISSAKGELESVKSQNSALKSKLEGIIGNPAELSKIATAKGRQLSQDQEIKAKIMESDSPETSGIKQSLQKIVDSLKANETSAAALDTQLKFLERGSAFYADQASQMLAFTGGENGLKNASQKLAQDAAGGPGKVFADYEQKFSNKAFQPTEQDLAALSGAYKQLTGRDVKVDGEAPATREGATSLLPELLKMRGADWKAFNDDSKLDDSKFTNKESDLSEDRVWPPVSPKKKLFLGKFDDQLEKAPLGDGRNVTPVLNIRVSDVLTDDLGALNTKLGDVRNTDIAALKTRVDELQKEADSIIGVPSTGPGNTVNTGGASTGTTTGNPPATSTGTVTPPVNNGNGNVTTAGNTAITKADTVLQSADPMISDNQRIMDTLETNKRNCTSKDVCIPNLKIAREEMANMKKLRGEIAALREDAAKPGADLAAIERQIGDKQRALSASDERFDAAAAIVAKREGIPSPSAGNHTGGNGNQHPTPTPDTNHGTSKPTPPPNVINTVVLYNGPTAIKAWDKDGKAIVYWACSGKITPKSTWSQMGSSAMYAAMGPLGMAYNAYRAYRILGGDPRSAKDCSTGWKQEQATIKVEDFALAPLGKVPSPAQRKLGNIPVYQEQVWIGDTDKKPQIVGHEARWARENWSVMKRGHYEMDIDVVCEWNGSRKRWEFKEVGMTHGTAESSDAYGVEAGVSAGIKVVDVDVKASYHHEQRHFNYGVKTDYTQLAGFAGMECK